MEASPLSLSNVCVVVCNSITILSHSTGEFIGQLIDKKSQAYQRYRQQRNNNALKVDFQLISARVKKEIWKGQIL